MSCPASRRVLTKAAWIRFETDPSFFFDFFLAEQLHMTVADVRAMPVEEWMQWGVYFGRKAQQRQLAEMRAGTGG